MVGSVRRLPGGIARRGDFGDGLARLPLQCDAPPEVAADFSADQGAPSKTYLTIRGSADIMASMPVSDSLQGRRRSRAVSSVPPTRPRIAKACATPLPPRGEQSADGCRRHDDMRAATAAPGAAVLLGLAQQVGLTSLGPLVHQVRVHRVLSEFLLVLSGQTPGEGEN